MLCSYACINIVLPDFLNICACLGEKSEWNPEHATTSEGIYWKLIHYWRVKSYSNQCIYINDTPKVIPYLGQIKDVQYFIDV